MADTKISALAAATTLAGTEVLPVVQSAVTVGATVTQVRAGLATLASPALTGTPTVPTATPGTNTTQASSTAYADAIAALKANIASPTFTGVPAVPTATALTATTQVASTAYSDAADTLSTINSQSGPYTLVLADAGKTIYHPSADTTVRTWTIPANASVAYPVGTCINIKNDISAGVLTISITTDTMVLDGAAGSIGSRTLAAGGRAFLQKMASTRWCIGGTAELT